jgi:hypothetical protein
MGRITRALKVNLTETELAERSARMAQLIREAGERELARKDADSRAKKVIAEIEATVSSLAIEVNEKAETRAVECRLRRDERMRTIEVIRLDTKEVIEIRPMTDEEAQASLFRPHDEDSAEAPQ